MTKGACCILPNSQKRSPSVFGEGYAALPGTIPKRCSTCVAEFCCISVVAFYKVLAVLWVIATILFLLFRLAPGDPTVAFIDPTFSEEQEQALRARFGLDKSLSEQYVIYLKNLVQGDLGNSFFRGATVSEMIMEALPNTLYLSFVALFLAYIIGVIGGTAMAVLRGGILEANWRHDHADGARRAGILGRHVPAGDLCL